MRPTRLGPFEGIPARVRSPNEPANQRTPGTLRTTNTMKTSRIIHNMPTMNRSIVL
jgi:hypothetical protein